MKRLIAAAALLSLTACAGLPPAQVVQTGVEAAKIGQALYCTFVTPEGRKTVRKKLTGTEAVLVDICRDPSVPAEPAALPPNDPG